MYLLVHLIERIGLVVGRVRLTFVVADGHSVIVSRREFAPKPNVVDTSVWSAEVVRKVQRQVVDAGELDDPADRCKH